ncbi:MAG: valine--tRNA ligase [Ferruginibacter sp.]|nr:valine--tRNA ligase [Ferruginibacter sp.]
MELSKNYIPNQVEANWYQHWLDKGYFNSVPDEREPYTIVIPPPNVTGVLHMGHSLNNTIQDILIRRARMHGKNACWVPGTDHASIATEAKVVAMLRERGIAKSSLSREEFLAYAWEWKEKYGGIILQQLKKLGCSLDWNRVSFTMDKDYYQSVIKIFVELYNKGSIYRGKRMINWDVKAKTALSDEEVIRKETKQKLYHIRYQIAEAGNEAGYPNNSPFGAGGGSIIIATVRPETIMGDTAICVHPDDERYKYLHGGFAIVPLINRRIPIITDEYVSMDFGTGALKVTPAHDMNDNQLGQKHGLEVIDILNDDGTLSEAAQIFIGEERFEARKKIVRQLEAENFLVKVEDYTSEVGYSERTDTVVEPRLSLQWWVKMKNLSDPALKAVMSSVPDGEEAIKFYPPKFKNTYRHWMENIRDWCISRQLSWGHRIPAWYDEDGNVYVAESLEALHKDRPETSKLPLKQDEDCLDTWFSSWLWPFEVFKGISDPGNAEVKYYYPTNTLVTAPEIIFFWVARMIMAGYEYMGEKPFNEVYFTGIVRDKLGRKMSKQLGNSPDLLSLVDQYGADAVRFGIMVSSPAGNDLMFDESTLEQGRNFNNKLWNALKLVRSWHSRIDPSATLVQSVESLSINTDASLITHLSSVLTHHSLLIHHQFATDWFKNRMNQVRAEVDSLMKQFRLSEALKTIYSLIWDDFCSWYLEWVKPGFEQPVEASVYNTTVEFFEEMMQLLHPFMPFITEEIYHLLKDQQVDLCVTQSIAGHPPLAEVLEQGELLKKVISSIRDARNKNQVKPKDTIHLHIQTGSAEAYRAIENILSKQVNAASISFTGEPVAHAIVVAVEKDKFYIESGQLLDSAALKNDLEKDLQHQQNFLISVQKKLSNERFVQNARPEVIDLERKKQADTEHRIRTIEESLAALN